MRRVLSMLLLGVAPLACESPRAPHATAPASGACDARRDATFRAFASTRASCSTSAECSIVRAECPLTSVAVRWTQADQVVSERCRLLTEATRTGSCADCTSQAPPPVASCVDGQCELALPTLGDGH